MNRIWHNSPLPTSFPYIVLRLFTFPLLLLSSVQNTKNITFTIITFCYRYHCYHITLLLKTLLQILSFQVWLNWQLSCQYLRIFFDSPCVESINLGWILYPRKLLWSPILVGYQRAQKQCFNAYKQGLGSVLSLVQSLNNANIVGSYDYPSKCSKR